MPFYDYVKSYFQGSCITKNAVMNILTHVSVHVCRSFFKAYTGLIFKRNIPI